ncbi:hypothetical protein BH23BAC3_BH23BAC3_27910 [soil metagenome]
MLTIHLLPILVILLESETLLPFLLISRTKVQVPMQVAKSDILLLSNNRRMNLLGLPKHL